MLQRIAANAFRTVALASFANIASAFAIDSLGDILLDAVDWPVFDIAALAISYPFPYFGTTKWEARLVKWRWRQHLCDYSDGLLDRLNQGSARKKYGPGLLWDRIGSGSQGTSTH